MNEPRRLLDDPSISHDLRDALRSADDDGPSPERLATLAATLGVGVTVAPAAKALGAKALALKLAIGALVVTTTVGVVWLRRSPPPVAPVAAPTPSVASVVTQPPLAPSAEPSAPIASVATVPSSSPPPIAAPRPPSESSLVAREQSALQQGDPSAALAAAAEHAKAYPNGSLSQERELFAIDALLRLGRREEAEQRAARFRARWPDSVHLRRIDVLLGR